MFPQPCVTYNRLLILIVQHCTSSTKLNLEKSSTDIFQGNSSKTSLQTYRKKRKDEHPTLPPSKVSKTNIEIEVSTNSMSNLSSENRKAKLKNDDDQPNLKNRETGSNLGNSNLNSFSGILLQAQEPYFGLNSLQPGSSSVASSMDFLQKCRSLFFFY